MVWSQEFDGPAGTLPDTTSTWNHDIGTGPDGWGNQEHEYYTDTNATCDGNGNLVIKAERVPADDPNAASDPRVEFYSSRIHTKGKVAFKYGRIEARIKMPKGAGAWPALWMLGTQIGDVAWPDSVSYTHLRIVAKSTLSKSAILKMNLLRVCMDLFTSATNH